MKEILLFLLMSASALAQGFDLTLPLPKAPAGVLTQKIVSLRQPLNLGPAGALPSTITNFYPSGAISATFTNLAFGTNTFTLVWINAVGESPPSAPLVVIQVPRPPSAPAAPPPFGDPTIVIK